jgi:hypothetical protein
VVDVLVGDCARRFVVVLARARVFGLFLGGLFVALLFALSATSGRILHLRFVLVSSADTLQSMRGTTLDNHTGHRSG